MNPLMRNTVNLADIVDELTSLKLTDRFIFISILLLIQ
jgi:hypothetical protein